MDAYEYPLPPPTGGPPASDRSLPLFLALYLVVLAFFILLVSISVRETARSHAVMNGLAATFAAERSIASESTVQVAKEEVALAARQFQSQVSDVFATALQVARVEIVQPGRLMRVRMPADVLFFAGEARLRLAHDDLLDRVVANLSARPPGLKFDLEFVIDTPYGEDRLLSAGEGLALARARVFIRDVTARGAPPDSLSMGLRPSSANEAIIWFFVRFPDEETTRFGLLREAPS